MTTFTSPTGPITGILTNATLFTRTSGTWVENELIGQYIYSYVYGTECIGVWCEISSNTSTTITTLTNLQASANRCFISQYNPITQLIAHNDTVYNNNYPIYSTCISVNDDTWLIPKWTSYISRIEIATGNITKFQVDPSISTGSLTGCCYDNNGHIWVATYSGTKILKINISDNSQQLIDTGGISGFSSCCYVDGYVWVMPTINYTTLKINIVTNVVISESRSAFFLKTITDSCYDENGTIWCSSSNYILKLNVLTNTISSILVSGFGAGACCYANGYVWFCQSARSGADILKVDISTNAMTAITPLHDGGVWT